MKHHRRLVLAVAALAAVVGIPTTAAGAQQRDPLQEPIGSDTVVNAWAVAPASQSTSPTDPSGRAYLTYSVVPGQVIEDAVTLFNYSNVPLTFRLYPTDAFNNADGSFDALAGDKKPKQVGSWVSVAQENIALPPKSQVRVPVTVRIPRGVTPGDHAGALLASSVAQGTGPDGRVVNVDRRTGTRIYIRVAGPLRPELAITKITNTYRPSVNPFGGKLDVTYRVDNTGNVRMSGKHQVSVSGVVGLGSKKSAMADLPELLPGEGVTLSASFKGMPATVLDFATVKVDPDDVEGERLGVVSRKATTVAIPWTIVALGLITGLGLYARRRYATHRGVTPGTHAESKQPQPKQPELV